MTNLGWDSTIPARAEERQFSIPPVGEYDFMVVGLEKTYSKAGKPMLKVRLSLSGADGSVFDNLVLTDAAMFKIISFFESIGIKKKGEELNLSISEAAEKAMGAEGRCSIIHEEYNGKTQAHVNKYLCENKPSAEDLPFRID